MPEYLPFTDPGAPAGGPLWRWRRLRKEWGVPGTVLAACLAALALWLAAGLTRGETSPGALAALAPAAWAAGAAAAACFLPLWGYLLACVWLGFAGLFFGSVCVGTPLAAVPVLWLLVPALWKTALLRDRRIALPLWAAAAFGAAWIMADASGWTHLLGPLAGGGPRGRIQLGLAFTVAGIAALPWLRRRLRGAAPGFLAVFLAGLVAGGAVAAASLIRDPVATRGWLLDAAMLGGNAAGPLWFWLASGFAATLAAGAGRLTSGMGGPRGASLLPALWVTVTVFEWLVTRESGLALASRVSPGFVLQVSEWPPELWLALRAHTWTGLVVAVIGAGFLWQGEDGRKLLPPLTALWLAAFPALVALGGVLGERAGANPSGVTGGLSAAVILLTGLWRDAVSPGSGRVWTVMGWLTFALTLTAASESARGAETWESRAGLAALLGVIHAGLPRVLHGWWIRARGGPAVFTGGLQRIAVLAGLFTALPVLRSHPTDYTALAACPFLWLPVLTALRWRRPELDAGDGALAGALLAAGAAGAWIAPEALLPEAPFFDFVNPSVHALQARPLLESAHFSVLLALLCAGALLGGLLFRRAVPPRGEIPIAIPAGAS